MATWVEDIVQALINLGGQAHRKKILEEIKRIRKEPLPERLAEVIQRTIQDHSSDSTGFRGNDLFKKSEMAYGRLGSRLRKVLCILGRKPKARHPIIYRPGRERVRYRLLGSKILTRH